VREDQRAAFDRLCRDEYHVVVRSTYLITGDRQEALDLAQEAFARAYERWRSVTQLDRPGAWVQRVAINLALSWRRRLRVARQGTAPREEWVDPPAASDDGLMRALGALTPAQRTVVVLRFCLDQSVEEVGRALGKRPGTVRALTAQGIARLRQSLFPEEYLDDITT
jgi:RNA polymerase sigma-70 factor (ECF subfamily)